MPTNMNKVRRSRSLIGRRNGQVIFEFAFAFPFLLVVLLGGVIVGLILDRQVAVAQLVRNAGNMYARDFDFEPNTNKQVLLRAASGLDIQIDGGSGIIYLSTVRIAPAGSGANAGLPVVVERFVIGNSAISDSSIAMPTALGNGRVVDPYDDEAAKATLPQSLVDSMIEGDRIFVSEVMHAAADLTFNGFVKLDKMGGRAFF